MGRLVAPITTTDWSSSSPSISERMVLTTRSVACGSPKPAAARGNEAESSSSMKITHGATCRARANSRAICCSLSPYHLREQVARLGGDEVRLRLARDCLGEQGLAGAGRAIEQEALGRADAEAAERVGILERQLDAFLEPHLRVVEPADIFPADARRLDHHFAHRRRLDALQCLEEILARHRQRIEHLRRDGAVLEVELGHQPPHRLDRRLAGERGEIGADEAIGRPGQLAEIDAIAERHAAGVDAEDLATAALVRHADDDLAVEPAGTAQRLVDRLGAVGRGDHDDVGARLQPVHQGQQLRDEALLGLARDLAALGRDRIDLVDEHDRRRRLGRLLEHLAQARFRTRHRPSP